MIRAQPMATSLAHDLASGWCAGARHCPSSNFDARPAGCEVDLLVIHGISLPAGRYGGPHIEALFCNALDPAAHPSFGQLEGLRVSAHFLIRRDGEVVQFVSTRERAWHAGVSRFGSRERCNDFSIGIELEGCDQEAYADVQYPALVALSRVLLRDYPALTRERVVGHSDIAPGRKTDPGPHFDWVRYRAELFANLASGQEVGH